MSSKLLSKEFALHVDCKCITWGKVSDRNYSLCLIKPNIQSHLSKSIFRICRKQLTCTADPTHCLKTAPTGSFEWSASTIITFFLDFQVFKVTGISLAMHWSEDSLLHSDMALQEAEATGDPFLGLYEEEDPFTWVYKRSWQRRLRKTENRRPCIVPVTFHLCCVWFYCY